MSHVKYLFISSKSMDRTFRYLDNEVDRLFSPNNVEGLKEDIYNKLNKALTRVCIRYAKSDIRSRVQSVNVYFEPTNSIDDLLDELVVSFSDRVACVFSSPNIYYYFIARFVCLELMLDNDEVFRIVWAMNSNLKSFLKDHNKLHNYEYISFNKLLLEYAFYDSSFTIHTNANEFFDLETLIQKCRSTRSQRVRLAKNTKSTKCRRTKSAKNVDS